MNYFTKNKMLFWCVVVLIILNAVTLTSVWFGKTPVHPSSTPQTQTGGQLMAQRLQLSDDQQLLFDQIRSEHFERTRPLQQRAHELRLRLLDELFSPQPDEAKIRQMQAELQQTLGLFEENLYRHFDELKNACQPQQTEALRLMLIDLIERTRPRDPHQRRPGPDGPMRPLRQS